MFLLDTNVVSEIRKGAKADAQVRRWAALIAPPSLYLSAISILELEIGVLLIERRDRAQGRLLRAWLQDRVLTAFEDRILPIDTAVARRCAALHVPDPHADRDALIAATALVHGMTVVTRNTADFTGTGVPLLNPWLAS
jgi:hypothetical protein